MSLPSAMYRDTDNRPPDVVETMRDAQIEALRRRLAHVRAHASGVRGGTLMPFVALDRRNPGPHTECYACSAWKKDHGPNGECPPSRPIDLVDHEP